MAELTSTNLQGQDKRAEVVSKSSAKRSSLAPNI